MKVYDLLGYQPTIYVSDGHTMNTPGKRTPVLPDGTQIKENEFNRPVADMFAEMLRAVGFRVIHLSPEVNGSTLDGRKAIENADCKMWRSKHPDVDESKITLAFDFHANALNGILDNKKGGIEIHIFSKGKYVSKYGKALAECVLKYLCQGTPQVNRGIKLTNMFMTRELLSPSILVESLFMDSAEWKLMLDPNYHREVATECLMGVLEYYGLDIKTFADPDPKQPIGELIINAPSASSAQAKAWAVSKGATPEFVELADIHWQLAKETGVNPVGSYAQSAKETGLGHFGGVIDRTYCNPCGMKINSGGDNYDPHAHKKFSNWPEGIEAQHDHLALYAGKEGYPKEDTPDPRHFVSICGKAVTWELLGGRWAPSASYGTEIVSLMRQIEKSEPLVPESDTIQHLKKQIVNLQSNLQNINSQYSALRNECDSYKAELVSQETFKIELRKFIGI